MASYRDMRFDSMLDQAARRAVDDDVPTDVIDYARKATRRALHDADASLLRPQRVKAYFDAVVRRRLVRTRSRATVVSRMLAETVVADLSDSGRSPSDVWLELERGWRGTIPSEVLDEFRVRLCA